VDWLHGFEMGSRFKSGVHALELTYQGAYQAMKASGDLNGGSIPFSDKMRFQLHSGGVGYQAQGERAGIGFDFQFQWYITKAELNPGEIGFKDVQNMTAAKFYFTVVFPGTQGVDLAVQPYYLLPFDSYDPDPLRRFLSLSETYGREKWTRFGLTVVFYNGEK
jgi:hypothetical protein